MKTSTMRTLAAAALVVAAVVVPVGAFAEDQYVRILFRQICSQGMLQLSEVAVYTGDAANGYTRVNQGLTTTSKTDPTKLGYGEYLFVKNPFGTPTVIASTGSEGSAKLFDASRSTKMCQQGLGNLTSAKDRPADWVALVMKLPEGTDRPTAYNFCNANDAASSRSPTYWSVDVSHDGVLFGEVHAQLPGSYPGTMTWYNGGKAQDADTTPYVFTQPPVYLAPIPNQRTESSGCEPPLALTNVNTGAALVLGTDYTVAYSDNTSAGTGKATVTGVAGTDYAGLSLKATFQIFDPTFTVTVPNIHATDAGFERATCTVVDPYDGAVLVEGKHYAVAYVGTNRLGSAAAVVRGLAPTRYLNVVSTNLFYVLKTGASSGKVSVTAASSFVLAEPPDAYFLGEAVTPEPAVLSAAGVPLVRGTDFDVAYANNAAKGVATMTVTGKAPHYGTQTGTYVLSCIYRVKPTAVGGGTGQSWDSPMTLAEALGAAGSTDEIWLQSGLYTNAVASVSGKQALLGGFYGDETPATPKHGDGRSVLDGCATNSSTGVATVLSVTAGSGADVRVEGIEVRRAKTRGVSVSMADGRATFANCRFYDNGYVSSGLNGRGVNASGNSASRLFFTDGDVTENRYKYNTGGSAAIYGQALYLSSVGRTTLKGTLFLRNGLVPSTGWRKVEGRENSHGYCLYATGSPLDVTDCDFVANVGLVHGAPYRDGGVIWLEGASASSFTSCRFLGNTTTSFEDNSTPQGGGTFSLHTTAGTLTTFDLCTFAYNISVGTVGTAYTQITGDARFRNSIFYANAMRHPSVGCADVYVFGGTCDVENSRLSASDSSSFRKAADAMLNLPQDIETRDPLFALSQADFLATYVKGGSITGTDAYQPWNDATMDLYGKLDCHLRSEAGRWDGSAWTEDAVTSPFLDAATEATPYANEPSPNGSRANLGGYGNTSVASKTPLGVPAVGSVSEDQTSDVGTVFYRFTPGGVGTYVATVYFCRGAANPGGSGTNGWDEVRTVATGVARGTAIEVPLGEYVPKGTSWHWRIVVVATGGADQVDGQTTAQYDLPPYKGRGGPAYVLHVWGDAGGRGDGSDWWNAFRTPEAAFAAVSATKSEIWIVGDVGSAGAANAAIFFPCTVRGGFTTNAFEVTAAARPADTVSRLTATNANVFLTGTVTAALTCERLRIERATNYGVSLTASAPIVFRDCDFVDTRTSGGTIHALGVSGAPSVTVERCRFTGNWSTSTSANTTSMEGAALFLSGCAKASVTDCLFATNGISPSVLSNAAARDEDGTGLAIHIAGTPAFFTNCVFAANRAVSHVVSEHHGMLYLDGASQGSVFCRCRFVATGFANWSNTSLTDTHSAPVVVRVSSAAKPVTFDFCTFAYNVYNNNAGCAGILASSGAVTVRNSIFFGNFRTANAAANLKILGTATADVAYTLFDGTNATYVAEAVPGAITWGAGIRLGDPRFGTDLETFRADVSGSTAGTNLVSAGSATRPLGAVDPCSINLHVASSGGYVDERTGRSARVRGRLSPAVDAGDPAVICVEPEPNGRRVNLGVYGNTPWATMTPLPGAVIRVR